VQRNKTLYKILQFNAHEDTVSLKKWNGNKINRRHLVLKLISNSPLNCYNFSAVENKFVHVI